MEEAGTDKHINNVTPREGKRRVSFSPTVGASDLGQLLEGPAQLEEPGDVTALRVVLAGAPRL